MCIRAMWERYSHTIIVIVMYLVAFLSLIIPVGVRKMDVATSFFHHFLDVVSSFTNDMRVLCVRHVHLQCDTVTLVENNFLTINHSFTVQFIIFITYFKQFYIADESSTG